MNVEELINKLKKVDPKSLVVCGVYNGFTDTYGVVDHIFEENYEHSIYNDLFGTPGQIDGRLISQDFKDSNKKIVYIGSNFPYQNGIGDKDINYDIQSLNDDPNYLWKTNGFEWIYDEDGPFWSYIKEYGDPDDEGNFPYEMINYYKNKGENFYTCELHKRVSCDIPPQLVTLYNPGIEDIRNAMELIGMEKKLHV